MGFEFFIASRLKLGNNEKAGSPSLNVALVGIILAIVIMILSVVIVLGFKNEITTKINNLDSHIKISNGAIGIDDNIATVDMREIANALNQRDYLLEQCLISAYFIISHHMRSLMKFFVVIS